MIFFWVPMSGTAMLVMLGLLLFFLHPIAGLICLIAAALFAAVWFIGYGICCFLRDALSDWHGRAALLLLIVVLAVPVAAFVSGVN